MRTFIDGVGVIAALELRQRLRSVTWYVLIGVFVGLVALVTMVLYFSLKAYSSGGSDASSGGWIFSTIVYFVLLLGTLVAPALSGTAINGDRDAGTLATTQVTLITTWQLIVGKFLAAWATALTFLGASVPFLLFSNFAFKGGLDFSTVVVSILVLAVELGVVAAIGVGLSGILSRSLFSIIVTYLIVAALSIGTLIAFTLGGVAVQTEVQETTIWTEVGASYGSKELGSVKPDESKCEEPEVMTYSRPRFDLFWGVLATNPYVLLADATPTTFSSSGWPETLFGSAKFGLRSAQQAPETNQTEIQCKYHPDYKDPSDEEPDPTPQEIIDSTTPGWAVGLLIHFALAGGALFWAWSRTRTPTGRLGRDSRIA
ncbi:MAG: ABC transporter permease [Rhodoglobus sp.]